MVKDWLAEPKRGRSLLPQNLHRNHFVEVVDIVVIFHRVRGNEDVHRFEEWMYFLIQIMLLEQQFLDWAKIITDYMHYLMIFFTLNKFFYMSSYIVYAIFNTRPWIGLRPRNLPPKKVPIYDYLDKLQLYKGFLHFKRIIDTFTMRMVRELQGHIGMWLSPKAIQFMNFYDSHFIQVPNIFLHNNWRFH